MKKRLLEQTLDLVGKTDIPARKICEDLRVSQRWYFKLKAGMIKDPGVNKIQSLHDYLSGKAA